MIKDTDSLDDPDNVCVYILMDICKESILRRLSDVINCHHEASEKNEVDDIYDVVALISQIEIYAQVWFVKRCPEVGKRSMEAIDLVKEFVRNLEEIEVYDAEL